MNNRRSLASLAVLAAAPLLAASCGLIPPRLADVDARYKARDVAYLKDLCGPGNDAPETRSMSSDGRAARARACRYMDLIEAENNKDCKTIVASYEKVSQIEPDVLSIVAKHFAECGLYKEIFEQMADYGGGEDSARLLTSIEDGGYPLEKELLKYAAENSGPRFLPVETANRAMINIVSWLIARNHAGHCAEITTAVTGAAENVRAPAIRYLIANKCNEAVPVAVDLLLAEGREFRELACETLGDIGDTTVLDKVNTLAETDAYYRIEEKETDSGRVVEVKEYTVRDACRAAGGKIKLRSK